MKITNHKKSFSYLILSIILTSCITEKELLTKIDPASLKGKVEIDGEFFNKNLDKGNYQTLIQILNYHQNPTIFKTYYKYDGSSQVKIKYDGMDQLLFSYSDTLGKLISQSIKVKNKGNYLAFKRKFTLIPIPLIFTYYSNEKTIVYVGNEGNLNLISGQSKFLWIFLTGGNNEVYNNQFQVIHK